MQRAGVNTKAPEVERCYDGAQLVRIESHGFWTKRQWRSFAEVSLAAGASVTYRIVASKPFLLTRQQLSCDSGALRAEIFLSPTPSGTWTAGSGQPIQKNRLDGLSGTSAITVTSGGAITGGTVVEILRTTAGSGGNVQTVSASENSIRGLPAGTYYIRLTATGASTGVYYLEWEELD
jgi:hypothetical protein